VLLTLTLPYAIAKTHPLKWQLALQDRKDQKRGIQIRRIEIFRCGEIAASRGGAKSDKNDGATFTTSLLTVPPNNKLAPPVALN
jgi:hypothetical protein